MVSITKSIGATTAIEGGISEAIEDLPDFSRLLTEGSPVAVLGAGSWGTALAALFAANGHNVRLWARDTALIERLIADRENRQYLPGAMLSESIDPTNDLDAAIRGAGVVVFAVPCGAIREVATASAPHVEHDALIISAAKGLEETTGLRMSQLLAEIIPGVTPRIVALSGPNLAVEIARGAPTASVAASENPSAALAAQRLFLRSPNPTFRVYTGTDLVGVELGGAVKNAIAIGSGILEGLGHGDNSRAALMTRGLAEAVRLGKAQGARIETFLGLAGVGDLIATGGSRLSRNHRVGVALGNGRSLEDILQELGQVAEGVPTTRVLCALGESCGVELPLCAALHAVLFEGKPVSDTIRDLMQRPPRDEYINQ